MKKILILYGIACSVYNFGMLHKMLYNSQKKITNTIDVYLRGNDHFATKKVEHSECFICLEDVANKDCKMCHNRQIICNNCVKNQTKCPLCRTEIQQDTHECFSKTSLSSYVVDKKQCPVCLHHFTLEEDKEWTLLTCCRQYTCQDCINAIKKVRESIKCPTCYADSVIVCKIMSDKDLIKSEDLASFQSRNENSRKKYCTCENDDCDYCASASFVNAKKDRAISVKNQFQNNEIEHEVLVSDDNDDKFKFSAVSIVEDLAEYCTCGNDGCSCCAEVSSVDLKDISTDSTYLRESEHLMVQNYLDFHLSLNNRDKKQIGLTILGLPNNASLLDVLIKHKSIMQQPENIESVYEYIQVVRELKSIYDKESSDLRIASLREKNKK